MARSIKKNFLFNSAYQILQVITPLITTPYLSRVLGPTQNGVFSYTQSITNYFVLFATLGMSMYGVRAIAQCGGNKELRSETFCDAYASQLLVGIIVLVAYLCYSIFVQIGGLLICAIWSMWVIYAVLDVSWLLFGCEEFRIPTMRSFATKLTSLAIIFLFVKSEADLWVYVLAIAGSYFVNAILIWPFVHRYVDYARPNPAKVKEHFLGSVRLFIPVIAVSVYTTLDKIMLGSMSSADQVAFFDYSEKISRMPLNIVTALGTVMLPRMSAELKQGNREVGMSLLQSSIWVMLAAAFAMSFGIPAVANEFVPVFFGKGYDACITIMSIMSVIIPIISTTNVIGKQYLLPSERDRQYTISLILGAAGNAVVNLCLIPQIGAMGAAIGTIVAETTILIVQVVYVRHELPLRSYVAGAIPFAIIGVMMFAVIRLVGGPLISAMGVTVVCLLLEILIGAIFYLAASLLYCLLSKSKQFKRLFGKYFRRLGVHSE